MNNDNYLMHFGVKGMKWGVRRYRNKDGSLTEEGKRRYSLNEKSTKRDVKRALKVFDDKNFQSVGRSYIKSLNNDPQLSRIRKEIKPVKAELLDQYDWDTSDDGGGGNPSKRFFELYSSYDKLRKMGYKREIEITEQYISKFNDARLKDLHYKGDIEIGRKLLDRYGGVKRNTMNNFIDGKPFTFSNKYGFNTPNYYDSIWISDDDLFGV